MRRLLLALAIALPPSIALAHGHSGGHSGGHMSGVSTGRASAAMVGGHVSGVSTGRASTAMVGGRMSGWNGGNWGRHHRHNRFFFVGGPFYAGYGYYGYDCWRWVPTAWGPRRIWVCDYF